MTILEAFQTALQHHQSGKLAEAETLYRQILVVEPSHADALHLLGVIASQLGQHGVAVDLISKAVQIAPNFAEAHNNLGIALKDSGAVDAAIAAYRRALEIKADYADAYSNLGIALRDQGCLVEAAAAYHHAIKLKPDFAAAHSNLGIVLKDQLKRDEAIASYRQAIQLQPDYVEAHSNLGNALKDQGNLHEAVASYHRAIQLRPDYAEVHINLGNALNALGHQTEAVVGFRRAIQLKPDCAEAHNGLGNALSQQGHLDEAAASYRRAIQLRPHYAEAHNNLAFVLKEEGSIEEAITACRLAVQLKPDDAVMYSNLVFMHHYMPGIDSAEIFREHRRWAEIHALHLAHGIRPHSNDRDSERRLRIGYVSPDFRSHSVAFFLESLLAEHDLTQVEVFCYSDVVREDGVTARLRAHAAQWRRIAGMPDEKVAALIREDGIDILVDLAGHTADNRLLVFARKPAPVQVTWLGYCNTTGMNAMDYRLTDAHADPPGTTEHLHVERLALLPDTAWCYRPHGESPAVVAPPAQRTGIITFGCFNVRPKITEEMLSLWVRLLLKVPQSRLLLKNLGYGDATVREQTLGLLAKSGLEPERVELVGHLPTTQEHLATYGRVDIALDSFPYHGTTTTCEALWMGVPVVVLAGDTHLSRVGVSLLSSIDLKLVASNPEDYLAIAVGLAGDIPRLAAMRSTLRKRMKSSVLMDAPRFARQIEQTYRQMWRQWCRTAHESPYAMDFLG